MSTDINNIFDITATIPLNTLSEDEMISIMAAMEDEYNTPFDISRQLQSEITLNLLNESQDGLLLSASHTLESSNNDTTIAPGLSAGHTLESDNNDNTIAPGLSYMSNLNQIEEQRNVPNTTPINEHDTHNIRYVSNSERGRERLNTRYEQRVNHHGHSESHIINSSMRQISEPSGALNQSDHRDVRDPNNVHSEDSQIEVINSMHNMSSEEIRDNMNILLQESSTRNIHRGLQYPFTTDNSGYQLSSNYNAEDFNHALELLSEYNDNALHRNIQFDEDNIVYIDDDHDVPFTNLPLEDVIIPLPEPLEHYGELCTISAAHAIQLKEGSTVDSATPLNTDNVIVCRVCCPFTPGEKLSDIFADSWYKLLCAHYICVDCAKQWFSLSKKCPFCRKDLHELLTHKRNGATIN